MNLSSQWSQAFGRQSLSDRTVYEVLASRGGIPTCHLLHYLQMHLEKLAKAALWDPVTATPPIPDFDRSHNVIAKVLPLVVKQFSRSNGLGRRLAEKGRIERIRVLCREIDLLAPSVDLGGKRPDNCEYPWLSESEDRVLAPCEHGFSIARKLRSEDGLLLLKAAAVSAERFAKGISG